MQPRFHLDEHLSPMIAVGLRRRGVDVTTAADAGLLGAPDDRQLAHATAEGRVMVTCDDDYLGLHAATTAHAGILFWTARNDDIGGIIRGVALVAEVFEAAELAGRVEWLP